MKTIIGYIISSYVVFTFVGCTCKNSRPDWEQTLLNRVDIFGHRNWIVVADSAYPKQSSEGIDTMVANEEHLEVLVKVLQVIEDAPHVKGTIMMDQELEVIPEALVPGISKYRAELGELTKGKEAKHMAHEEIIAELDHASKIFNILILKTNMTLPYTSVFIQLDCGYWNARSEEQLRSLIQETK